MKYHTTKTIIILSAILFIASALAYGYLFLLYMGLFANMPSRYNTNAKSKATLTELNRVEQNLKNTLANKDQLTALFIKESAVADFIQMLETIMRQTYLSGSVDSVSDDKQGEGSSSNKTNLTVSLTANGQWQDIVRFVGLIEKIPYKSTVDTVSFSQVGQIQDTSDKKIASERKWNINVKMHVLMIKSKSTDKT